MQHSTAQHRPSLKSTDSKEQVIMWNSYGPTVRQFRGRMKMQIDIASISDDLQDPVTAVPASRAFRDSANCFGWHCGLALNGGHKNLLCEDGSQRPIGSPKTQKPIAMDGLLDVLVAWGGIEPPTQGFSVLCSTD